MRSDARGEARLPGFGSATLPSSPDAILVIVHPAGQLERSAFAGFWTEVPALPACAAEGDTMEQALVRTRLAILGWITATSSEPLPALRVEVAL